MKTAAKYLGAGLVMLMCAQAYAAEPDLARAQQLLEQGKAAEAYSLLEPFEFDKAGDVQYDYLLGVAALNSGNPSKATFIFERILAQEPNYVGVRLDMARAYYEMGDYARAKIEFETVIVFESLPPDLKSAATQYLTAIQQFEEAGKTAWTAYVEVGAGHNSNINSGVSQNPIVTPYYLIDPTVFNPSGIKTGSRYANLALGGEVTRRITNGVSFYAGADAAGRGYDKMSDFNYGLVNARAGFNFSHDAWLFSVGLNGGRNYSHGVPSFDSRGGSVEARYLLNNSNQVSASAQSSHLRFVDDALASNNYNQYTFGLGWLHAFPSGKTALTVNLSAGTEQTTEIVQDAITSATISARADGDKRFQGARLGWQSALTEKVGAFVGAGFQHSQYGQQNATFLVNRDDKLYDVSMGVTWEFAKSWNLRPQLAYLRNDSNIPFSEYNGLDVSLNLRRSF